MSADDPLLSAFAALRDVHDGEPDGPQTRQRVLAGARRRADGRRRLLFVLIPAAATLLVSAAWADGSGRLGPWRAAIRLLLEPSRAVPAPVRLPEVAASPRPSLPLRPMASPSIPPAAASEPAIAAEAAAPVVRGPEALRPALRTPPPEVPAPRSSARAESSREATDREDDLFAAAHAAHFGARDAAAALHAWDAYLAAFPRGRFELEARYNRATALLRLGRDDEARTALLPFAEGQYRRREARLLLQALGEGR